MSRIAPDIRVTARRLRAEATPEERLLWRQLREVNRMIGTNFRRQAAIGRYIVDFADYRRRLGIEIDGSQHGTEPGAERDRARDVWLAGQGFTVLRFWNAELRDNVEGVMQAILDAVTALGPDHVDGAGP